MSDKKSLLKAIAKEESLLTRLAKVREQTLSRIQDYKRELASLEEGCSESPAPYAAMNDLGTLIPDVHLGYLSPVLHLFIDFSLGVFPADFGVAGFSAMIISPE